VVDMLTFWPKNIIADL